jgi:predicted nuclease of predicted toxin-antitoxin system
MKFLVDECTGSLTADWLRSLGYDVKSVFDDMRGASDDVVMNKARNEQRILITNDKDFGEAIFRSKKEHHGVILLRLANERTINKIAVLSRLFNTYPKNLAGNFIVVTEKQIRFAQNISP